MIEPAELFNQDAVSARVAAFESLRAKHAEAAQAVEEAEEGLASVTRRDAELQREAAEVFQSTRQAEQAAVDGVFGGRGDRAKLAATLQRARAEHDLVLTVLRDLPRRRRAAERTLLLARLEEITSRAEALRVACDLRDAARVRVAANLVALEGDVTITGGATVKLREEIVALADQAADLLKQLDAHDEKTRELLRGTVGGA